jgi:uncharacterized protein YjbJ (UPF0337 family)
MEGYEMNWDIVKGNWKQFRGRVKEQWGDLTDDDLDRIAGKRDQLVGRIQEKYGISKDEANTRIYEWERDYRDDPVDIAAERTPSRKVPLARRI